MLASVEQELNYIRERKVLKHKVANSACLVQAKIEFVYPI